MHLNRQLGASLIEMALLLGLIVVVAMIGITRAGKESRDKICDGAGGMERLTPGSVEYRFTEGKWCCSQFVQSAGGGWGGGGGGAWVCL